MTLDKISHHTVLDQCFVANLTVHLSLPSMKQIDWKHWGIPILPFLHPLSSSPSSPCRKPDSKKRPHGSSIFQKPTEVSRISGVFRKAKRPDFNGRWVCISTYGLDEARSKLGKMVETSARWVPPFVRKSDNRGAILVVRKWPRFPKTPHVKFVYCIFLAGVRHCDVFFCGFLERNLKLLISGRDISRKKRYQHLCIDFY